MKPIKFFPVFSIALIITGVTAGLSKNIETRTSQNSTALGIRYQVIIHLGVSAEPCNTYLVKVENETGQLVAPAQRFIPGVNKYSFIERVSVRENMQERRVAVLEEIVFPVDNVCATPLYTIPDVKTGPFQVGQIYTFDLYPNSLPKPTN